MIWFCTNKIVHIIRLFEIVAMLKGCCIFSISKHFLATSMWQRQSENALCVSSCSAEQAPLCSSGCTHRLLEVLSQRLDTVYKRPSSLYHIRGVHQFLNECTRRGKKNTEKLSVHSFKKNKVFANWIRTTKRCMHSAFDNNFAWRHTCTLAPRELRNVLHNSRNVAPGLCNKVK